MSELLKTLMSRLPDIRAAGDLGLRLLPQRRPGAGGRLPRGAHAGPVMLQSKLTTNDVCGYVFEHHFLSQKYKKNITFSILHSFNINYAK